MADLKNIILIKKDKIIGMNQSKKKIMNLRKHPISEDIPEKDLKFMKIKLKKKKKRNQKKNPNRKNLVKDSIDSLISLE